jgi:hypothetical protein
MTKELRRKIAFVGIKYVNGDSMWVSGEGYCDKVGKIHKRRCFAVQPM